MCVTAISSVENSQAAISDVILLKSVENDAPNSGNISETLENSHICENSSQLENTTLLKNTAKLKNTSKNSLSAKTNSTAKKSGSKTPVLSFIQEQARHDASIEELNAKAFGPARFTRAAHLIREDGGHDLQNSFVVEDGGKSIASVRMTEIKIADIHAYLLGPLVVSDQYKGVGLGGKLIEMAIQAVKVQNCPLVILVGDAPYYSRFGFQQVEHGQMHMPAPIDPRRLLALELQEGALMQAKGLVQHKNRAK